MIEENQLSFHGRIMPRGYDTTVGTAARESG